MHCHPMTLTPLYGPYSGSYGLTVLPWTKYPHTDTRPFHTGDLSGLVEVAARGKMMEVSCLIFTSALYNSNVTRDAPRC